MSDQEDLVRAARTGDNDAVAVLIKQVTDEGSQAAALWWAICGGHTPVVKTMADANVRLRDVFSAVAWAEYKGYADTVAYVKEVQSRQAAQAPLNLAEVR
jgi:hypothetical protein